MKGEFFRYIAEQGHYAGRTVPSATRQGLYACTASGTLLASINTRSAEQVIEMLNKALEAWHAMDEAKRSEIGPYPLESYTPDVRYHFEFPEDGLVLRTYSRDLPRRVDTRPDDWRKSAVNINHAWFTRDEMLRFVPPGEVPGTVHPIPRPLVRRFALFHFVDNVRGETDIWRDEQSVADMKTEIVERQGEILVIRLSGFADNAASGRWAIRPFQEEQDRERGVKLLVEGVLHWDLAEQKFRRFDVVAYGTRWGGTEHNLRWDDLNPSPIAIVFELAGDAAKDRVPPQHVYRGYFR